MLLDISIFLTVHPGNKNIFIITVQVRQSPWHQQCGQNPAWTCILRGWSTRTSFLSSRTPRYGWCHRCIRSPWFRVRCLEPRTIQDPEEFCPTNFSTVTVKIEVCFGWIQMWFSQWSQNVIQEISIIILSRYLKVRRGTWILERARYTFCLHSSFIFLYWDDLECTNCLP